jgi:hypothetical protein
LRREGDPLGAETAFDEESKRLYHLRTDGSVAFHENPPGEWVKNEETGEWTFMPEGYIPHPFGVGLVEPAGLIDRLNEREAREKAARKLHIAPGQELTPEQAAEFDTLAAQNQAALDEQAAKTQKKETP